MEQGDNNIFTKLVGWGGTSEPTLRARMVLGRFKAYLFIKRGSAFTTIVHLLMKSVAIIQATQHLQGRIIGFIRDRTLTYEPTPVLSQNKSDGNG